jgi:hypothetical protein
MVEILNVCTMDAHETLRIESLVPFGRQTILSSAVRSAAQKPHCHWTVGLECSTCSRIT